MSKRDRENPPVPELVSNPLPGLDPAPAKKRRSRWGDEAAPTPGLGLQGELAESVQTALRAVSSLTQGALSAGPSALALASGALHGGAAPGVKDPQRRVWVGNLPPGTASLELLAFLNEGLLRRNPGIAGLAVSNAVIMNNAAYTFVDAQTPDLASQCIAYFDNAVFKGSNLRVRRTRDYVPPPEGDPADRIRRSLTDQDLPPPVPPHPTEGEVSREAGVFIGNLNPVLREDVIKDVLSGCGELKAFKLIFDREDSELSAGYAFAEYAEEGLAPAAVLALKGLHIAGRHWAVCRAGEGMTEAEAAAAPYAVPPFIRPLLAPPTRVLEISGIVEGEGGAAALEEDEERLRALEADVRTECRRFGRVKSLHVARPNDPLRRAQEAAAAQAPAPAPLLLTGGAEPAFKPIPFVRSSEGPQAPDFPAAAEPGVGEGPPGGARGAEGEGADEPLPPLGKAWGLGKVYVEFMRPEVCAEVAHNLHGRTFEGRPLTCAFFPLKLYQRNFGKGLAPATRDARMEAAIAVQARLLDPRPLFGGEAILGHVSKAGGEAPAPAPAPGAGQTPPGQPLMLTG